MPEYTIVPLTLSRMLREKGMMTYLSNYGVKEWRPYTFWCIQGADLNVIVDTSANARDYLEHVPGLKESEIESVQDFEDALGSLGLKPEEIDLVIQTHLHTDHCMNTQKCTNAKVLVQEEEVQYAFSPHKTAKMFYDEAFFRDLNFEVVRGEREVLPGISVIPSPGHTPGGQSVAIQTKKRKAVIAGFCCINDNFYPPKHLRESSLMAGQPVIVPGIHVDPVKAFESLLYLKGLADIIIPSHEPEMANKAVIPD